MKNIFLTVVFTVIIATSAFAQSGSGFGLKGGVNYNANAPKTPKPLSVVG